jgi:hypothetical protein
MYIYTFVLRKADTMTSQNIDLSSWNSVVKQGSVKVKTLGRLKALA